MCGSATCQGYCSSRASAYGSPLPWVSAEAPKPLNYAFSSYATTIFEVMSKLAAEHQSTNLGQGFPDQEGPDSMKQIATKALYELSNQYPSLLGVPQLRQAVARHSEKQQALPCNWATETLITVGATEGIASAFMGMVNTGDEVRQHIALAGTATCNILCVGITATNNTVGLCRTSYRSVTGGWPLSSGWQPQCSAWMHQDNDQQQLWQSQAAPVAFTCV